MKTTLKTLELSCSNRHQLNLVVEKPHLENLEKLKPVHLLGTKGDSGRTSWVVRYLESSACLCYICLV